MRVSLGWLRELLQDPTLSATVVAERLTAAGLEVEAVTPFGAGLEPVRIVAVTGLRPHPHRSGLRLVTVDLGGDGKKEIVCGAPNVPDPGGLVVLAPMGTTLPAIGVTLGARDIGGVVSEGMLCSERELGIGFPGAGKAEDDGIIVLPAGFAAPGTPLATAIPAVQDTVFEVGVTPNRPDALGHLGVARELAALLDRPFDPPAARPFAGGAPKARAVATSASEVSVTIADDARARCREYDGHVVVDVTIGPSPLAVRYRLHALGVRAISNAVDVTNLVMMLYGQPLHAFDLDRLDGRAIHVRRARAAEQVVTLDGQTRTLVEDDLVICDGGAGGGKPVALAGVMGAGNSEIGPDTRRVLLECAYFEPRTVRRTARRHGLHSESSHRFERGVDPGAVAQALEHAVEWLADLTGGTALTGAVRVVVEPPVRARILLRHARLEALLGVPVPEAEAAAILTRLGCTADGDAWLAPTHRPDLGREVDLIEEVARVRGLDRIPAILPTVPPQAPRTTGVVERRARLLGAELGLSEAISYGFASPRDLAAVGAPEASVHLQNPLGEERGVMRTSLLPGLFSALRRARQYGEARVRLFEVGARFLASTTPSVPCDELPTFAAILAGPRQGWPGEGGDADLWDGKGIAVELVERLTGRRAEVRPLAGAARPSTLHPRGAAEVCVGEARVGTFGVLHPDVVAAFELDRGTAAASAPPVIVEIDLRAIEALGPRARPRFSPLPSLPAVTRDVALEVEEPVTGGALAEAIRAGAGPLCALVEVFDVYRGKGVAEGRKSIALRVTYRDPAGARTLTDAEVDECQKKAVAATASLGAAARG